MNRKKMYPFPAGKSSETPQLLPPSQSTNVLYKLSQGHVSTTTYSPDNNDIATYIQSLCRADHVYKQL